jgi:uncharacterized membrane protein
MAESESDAPIADESSPDNTPSDTNEQGPDEIASVGDLAVPDLGFNPQDLMKQLFDNVNFGGPEPEGDLPPQLVAVFYRAIRMSSGPIPRPEVLAEYRKVQADLPDRIVAMAERQETHRHGLETQRLRNDGIGQMVGTIGAFVIVLVALIGGIVLIATGHSPYGFAIILLPVIGLAVAYRKDMKRISLSLGRKAKLSIRASGNEVKDPRDQ